MEPKVERQRDFFRNRLAKNEKALRRWARNEGVYAYRLYDNDIPEVPLALDWYRAPGAHAEGADRRLGAAYLCLYDRPYEKAEEEEAAWLGAMADAAAEVLGLGPEGIFLRTRRRMRGLGQYEKVAGSGSERIVHEGGLSFLVNLSDYLDTGLFLDHRPLRLTVGAEARGKAVLNLFAYTGAFSVHAAAGGASRVDTVDLSNTYLDWAGRNLALNKLGAFREGLHRADVMAYLAGARHRGEAWDLIVVDPPTFSNSKANPEDFDVNRDWPALLAACLAVLAPGGRIYFSSNSRRLPWKAETVLGLGARLAEDITPSTIPPDFRDARIHRAFRIEN